MDRNTKIYWVGPRKSDINAVTDIQFYGSITIFGDGENNNYAYCLCDQVNRVNHNVSDLKEDEFFYETIKRLILEDSCSRFYFYNPNAAYYIAGLEEFKDYFINVNEKVVMKNTNNKVHFQKRLKGLVPLLDRKFDFHRNNCNYNALVETFNCDLQEKPRFVFQAPVSSGGNGTYIVSKDNVDSVVNMLDSDGYIVSVYREQNIPVNIHAIIFEDKILLSPGSIQLMREDDYRLLYRGADFIAYQQIDKKLRKKFEDNVRIACRAFQEDGYRGVCGIDGMICGDEVFLLELNNRFQASTGLVNLGAKEAKLPSTQKINLAAFNGEWSDSFLAFEKMTVSYSTYFFTDNGTKFHSEYIHNVCSKLFEQRNNRDAFLVDIEDDGYDKEQHTNALAYLYRLIFSTNIASVNYVGQITLNENIVEPDKKQWYDYISPKTAKFNNGSFDEIRESYLRLKIALLVQGTTITTEAAEYMNVDGGIRPATNNAMDICINVSINGQNKYLIVNVPTDVKFVQFSPFAIHREENKYYIYYYNQRVMEISIYKLDPLEHKFTTADPAKNKKSISYKEVAFLSTDRLRVHLTNRCKFKSTNEFGEFQGCKFCNIAASSDEVSLDNINEVVEDYCKHAKETNLRHFLVGGQTAHEADENLINIIQIIRQHAYYAPIYAMVIPYSNETIRKMYDVGMTQLACNIEVFDDQIAQKIMPGKRATSCEQYIKTLKHATTFMGRTGNVRSMVIVGLEEHKSLKEGITELVKNGIQPILSIFRPLPNTELEGQNAPSMIYLAKIYREFQDICKKYALSLGPDCVNCQNNTLALPSWLEK